MPLDNEFLLRVVEESYANGWMVHPGSDRDVDLLVVDGVTGAPKISWDESEDAFSFNKGLILAGTVGLDVAPGSDTDADLITLNGVTGTPKVFWDESEDAFSFNKGLRITVGNKVVVGHTSPIDFGAIPNFQVIGTSTTSASMGFARFENNAGGPDVRFLKSRSGTIGTNTIVQNGDTLGRIRFQGADGIDFNTTAAQIHAEVDGTPGANDMPGRLIFSTTSDGSSSVTERARITSAGKLGINLTDPNVSLETDIFRVRRSSAASTEYLEITVNDNRAIFHSVQDESGGTAGGFQFDLGGANNVIDSFLITQNSDLATTPSNVLFTVRPSGVVIIADLAGTGTRNVVADANGVLSAP